MRIDGVKSGKALVVHMRGRLDAVGAPEFEKKCLELVDTGECIVILSFKEVEFISTMGLRSVLILGKRIKAENGTMLLCEMNKMVSGVFDSSGFSSIMSIYNSLDNALEAIG